MVAVLTLAIWEPLPFKLLLPPTACVVWLAARLLTTGQLSNMLLKGCSHVLLSGLATVTMSSRLLAASQSGEGDRACNTPTGVLGGTGVGSS